MHLYSLQYTTVYIDKHFVYIIPCSDSVSVSIVHCICLFMHVTGED